LFAPKPSGPVGFNAGTGDGRDSRLLGWRARARFGRERPLGQVTLALLFKGANGKTKRAHTHLDWSG